MDEVKTEAEAKVIVAEKYSPGYNITTVTGRYSGPVTAKDIQDRFYNPYFGGRSAVAKDGRFSVVVHND